MDPLFAFLLLFAAAILVCLAAMASSRPATRACASCGHQTEIKAQRCRHCGYRSSPVLF
jgi:hypothetical protein